MAKVRGSASWSARALVAIMAVSVLLRQADYVQAYTYKVGDGNGWTFNVVGWLSGKQFEAGDHLLFIYDPWYHDVTIVGSEAYNTCQIPEDALSYVSGNDSLALSIGENFFTSSFPGDCDNGLKIAVTVV